jgi:hypothetical protein
MVRYGGIVWCGNHLSGVSCPARLRRSIVSGVSSPEVMEDTPSRDEGVSMPFEGEMHMVGERTVMGVG